LSWADFYRPNALAWFDRQMAALHDFNVTITFCFTPEHKGVWPHYTAPPQEPAEFAEFCAGMIRRYGGEAVPEPIGSAGAESPDTFEKADVLGNG
jgi:beta-xylosidase